MTDSKPSTRVEKDSLGHKEIPGHVYYGIQTARAVENYPISGLRAHPTLIRAIAMVKEAAAMANRELGLVDKKTADAIIDAAKEVQQGKWDEHFPVDVFQAGAGVSFHMNSNEVIANRASELLGGARGEYKHVHPNDHVNYGQSTNDVFPTAMRLATLLELEQLYPVLDDLVAALEAEGQRVSPHPEVGTHAHAGRGADAAGPGIHGVRRRDQAREEVDCRSSRNYCARLGWAARRWAPASTPIPTIARRRLPNWRASRDRSCTPVDDMRYAMQSNLAMSSVSSALRNLALEVIRISNDLRLLSSGPNTGLGGNQLCRRCSRARRSCRARSIR